MMPMRNSPLGQGEGALNPFGSAFMLQNAPGMPAPAPMPGGTPMASGAAQPNSPIPGAPGIAPGVIERRLGLAGASSPLMAPEAFPPSQGNGATPASRLLQRMRG